MKYWVMPGAGLGLFIAGAVMGAQHMSAPAASILFIIGIVLLALSIDKVGKRQQAAGDGSDQNSVGDYQI